MRGNARGSYGGRGGSSAAGDRQGPKLPVFFLNQLAGGGDDDDGHAQHRPSPRGKPRAASRKEKRKAGRQEKKETNVAYFRQRAQANQQKLRQVQQQQRLEQQQQQQQQAQPASALPTKRPHAVVLAAAAARQEVSITLYPCNGLLPPLSDAVAATMLQR